MTAPADLVAVDGVVHPRPGAETAEALAIRDGTVVRVGSTAAVDFLTGVETTVVDLDGRHVLPGFVDAHTHLGVVGRQAVEADLSGLDSRDAVLDALADHDTSHRDDDWLLGFGYDESRWGGDYLTRSDLDSVSEQRPVATFREDLHVVSVNGVALDRLGDLPPGDVRTTDGDPTGVLVEGAVDAVTDAVRPGPEATREYLLAAQARAHERGVTAVHDMVRESVTARVYRDVDSAGALTLRVRLNYWADHLDAVLETGLRTNHGTDRLRVGAIKTFADGSLGGHTARLSEPYADDDRRGDLLETPEDLRALVERADDAGHQVAVHAIGDEAIAVALDALDGTDGKRHRIEHAEVLTDDLVERLAASEVVVSAQPNFLKWAGDGGLYDRRLGERRRRDSNRYRDLLDAGATLAFGSDCMPLDPLYGVDRAVTAPDDAQRLSVTEALRAYTSGAAYAGFDEGRLGALDVGMAGDFVALAASPWAAEDVAAVDVDLTVVGGEVVHDGR